jgi:IS30 family transposase
MAGKEPNVKDVNEIRRLYRLGLGKRQIARTLNIHRNTVSKHVEGTCDSQVSNDEPLHAEQAGMSTIDWEKVRQEYLRGVPLNIIYDVVFT